MFNLNGQEEHNTGRTLGLDIFILFDKKTTTFGLHGTKKWKLVDQKYTNNH